MNKKIFKIKGDGKRGNYKFGNIVWLTPNSWGQYVCMEYSAENWYSDLHCWVLKGTKWLVHLTLWKIWPSDPVFVIMLCFWARLTSPFSTQEYKLLIYYWSGEFNQTCGEISGILPWTGVSNPGSVSCNIPLYGMIRTLNGTLYFSNQFFVAIKQHNLFFSHRLKKVPDVIFATTEPPVESPIVGRGCLLQAR